LIIGVASPLHSQPPAATLFLVDSRQCGSNPENPSTLRPRARNGLMGSTGITFQDADKVNSLRLNPRSLIALHSPSALLETGLRMCLPEKSQDSTAFDAEQSVLYGPVCLGIIAKYGHYSRIPALNERNFSAVQTAWRREQDSNPRYSFAALSLDISVSCR